ncbi:diphthine--ammonia ligase [Parasteatoda tepidariorum]|uniref:diphthine--ammonia ligase n=1 Tax=Parasteatoda tepidariorum TaxID=114398 RepID=UPI0039BC2950
MKVVALISGGKDSCYNMMQCVADGHEIVALAHMMPKKDEMDSYMYQSVGHEALNLYAEAMGLPLYQQEIEGAPLKQTLDYQQTSGDEVEDLFNLLSKVKNSVDIEAVSVGAIFSDYQRLRVENVCKRLNLEVFSYLWHKNQEKLLQEIITSGVHAIIIKVAALGLEPEVHLGMSLEEIYPHMIAMNKQYGLNICGEGGEFESFTLDCPLFKKRLEIKEKETIIHADNAFAPVGYLKFKKVELCEKK